MTPVSRLHTAQDRTRAAWAEWEASGLQSGAEYIKARQAHADAVAEERSAAHEVLVWVHGVERA